MVRSAVASTSSTQLAVELAHHTRAIARRARVLLSAVDGAGLAREIVAVSPVVGVAAMADGLAQTLAYGALARRWLPAAFDLEPGGLGSLPARWAALARRDELLAGVLERIEALLRDLDLPVLFADHPDPLLHFYEDFLQAYDPQQRRRLGAYYTPEPLVAHVVDIVDAALRRRFGLALGLADLSTWGELEAAGVLARPGHVPADAGFVRILDPALGTGAVLLGVVARIHRTMAASYGARGLDDAAAGRAWCDYVRRHLLPRLRGQERMLAPAVIAHLRLALALHQTGFEFNAGDRLPIVVADTLAPPSDQVAPAFTVILGNPPYARESVDEDDPSHDGGWIRDGRPDWRDGRPPLEDFLAPARERGAGGHLKNVYNLYVYFWRFACWAIHDCHDVGIISFVTPSSFLAGPGFVGMREALRRRGTEIAVVDLEGDQRGARSSDNVFAIKTPVCATTLITTAALPEEPARARYRRLRGDRAQKLAGLAGVDLDDEGWLPAPRGWGEPLVAVAAPQVAGWPRLSRVFPLQLSGCKAGRTWVVGETRELLEQRWATLLAREGEARTEAFKDSPTGRRADRSLRGQEAILELGADAPVPTIERFAARSFDRQWILADPRLLDRPGPQLWALRGPGQIFMTIALTGVLGSGPAATISTVVPDLHHFCGRGGRDVIPLWRDLEAREANVDEGILDALAPAHGRRPTGPELFAYAYAVLANPGYVRRFEAA
ncbi:MAG: hypothetical protein KC431_07560, partial [Myxococcales bacterium]|nr:hypothetical protein [Myxococcales bacterium]